MAKEMKTRMISLRITERQYRCLEDLSRKITRQSGFRITRASIILKLMEYGLPILDRAFPEEAEEHPLYRTGTDDF